MIFDSLRYQRGQERLHIIEVLRAVSHLAIEQAEVVSVQNVWISQLKLARLDKLFHAKEGGNTQNAHDLDGVNLQLTSVEVFEKLAHGLLRELREASLLLILVTPLALAKLGEEVLAACREYKFVAWDLNEKLLIILSALLRVLRRSLRRLGAFPRFFDGVLAEYLVEVHVEGTWSFADDDVQVGEALIEQEAGKVITDRRRVIDHVDLTVLGCNRCLLVLNFGVELVQVHGLLVDVELLDLASRTLPLVVEAQFVLCLQLSKRVGFHQGILDASGSKVLHGGPNRSWKRHGVG